MAQSVPLIRPGDVVFFESLPKVGIVVRTMQKDLAVNHAGKSRKRGRFSDSIAVIQQKELPPAVAIAVIQPHGVAATRLEIPCDELYVAPIEEVTAEMLGLSRAQIQAADQLIRQFRDDAHFNDCTVCHSGGTLLLCDRCMNAMHSACCISNDEVSFGSSEWLCYECLERPSPVALAGTFFEVTRRLLGQLESADAHKLFHSPVPVDYVIASYAHFVANPVDLSMVRIKVEKHCYSSIAQFQADVTLMVKNCTVFNRDDEEMVRFAESFASNANEFFVEANAALIAAGFVETNGGVPAAVPVGAMRIAVGLSGRPAKCPKPILYPHGAPHLMFHSPFRAVVLVPFCESQSMRCFFSLQRMGTPNMPKLPKMGSFLEFKAPLLIDADTVVGVVVRDISGAMEESPVASQRYSFITPQQPSQQQKQVAPAEGRLVQRRGKPPADKPIAKKAFHLGCALVEFVNLISFSGELSMEAQAIYRGVSYALLLDPALGKAAREAFADGCPLADRLPLDFQAGIVSSDVHRVLVDFDAYLHINFNQSSNRNINRTI